jgi:Fe-Mn family superoxide dismutase
LLHPLIVVASGRNRFDANPTSRVGKILRQRAQNDTIPSISPEELALVKAGGEPLQVIDARPRYHFSRSADMMAEAVPRDPDRVHEWAAEPSAGTPVIVYCSYGFNVGCAVTATLRERGFDARFLRGGLSAWYAAGGARALRQDTSALSS